jgi:hypothetical protein
LVWMYCEMHSSNLNRFGCNSYIRSYTRFSLGRTV